MRMLFPRRPPSAERAAGAEDSPAAITETSPDANPPERRLHPLTLLFRVLGSLRYVLLPAVPLLFFGPNLVGRVSLVLLFVGIVAQAVIEFFSVAYRLQEDALVIRRGLFAGQVRHIPLARIQEVNWRQNPLHRLLGVVDVRLETSGGSGPEATLSVLSLGDAESLKSEIAARQRQSDERRDSEGARGEHVERDADSAQTMTPASRLADGEGLLISRLGVKELVLAGLTSNHIFSVLAIVGASLKFFDEFAPRAARDLALNLLRSVSFSSLRSSSTRASDSLVAALSVIVLIGAVGIAFSVASSVWRFYGFTLRLDGRNLQRRFGLFSPNSITLPRERVQSLKIEENVLRRALRLAALRADTSGNKRDAVDREAGRDVLIPLTRRGEIDKVLPLVFRGYETDRAEWRRVSELAVRRAWLPPSLATCAASIGWCLYREAAGGLWLLVLLPLIYLWAVSRYKQLSFAGGAQYFRCRRGWLGRATYVVPIRNAQVIEVRQTFFDRRLKLGTVSIDTAGKAYAGGGPRVGNLPIREALRLARRMARQSAKTPG